MSAPLIRPSAGRPLVISHRGAGAAAPENTFPAFRLGFEAGAAWLETDVQPTADNVPVLLHDDDVDRTTDGTGAVRSLTAAQVAELDAGSWFSPELAGTGVPTLAGLLETLGSDQRVLLEIKGPHTREQVGAVLGVLASSGRDEQVLVQSFEVDALRLVRELQPDRPTGLLVETIDADPIGACAEVGAVCYNPFFPALLTAPGLVDELHAAGIAVVVWTVDDPGSWTELVRLGVDGIITNTPAELLRHLG